MPQDATQLLRAASCGDKQADERLSPLVYDALRGVAAMLLRHSGSGKDVVLQPTALVHEAYVKLVNREQADYRSETHFRAVAAVAMRHIVIDQARKDDSEKRGGGRARVTLSGAEPFTHGELVDALGLDEVLSRLAEQDERAARVVELRFFGGLTDREIGETLGVSDRTVRNDWTMARAWLKVELGEAGSQS